MKKSLVQTEDYSPFLSALKSRIEAAQLGTVRAVNQEWIHLYWDIGASIVARQQEHGWGESVINKLSKDLRSAFPEMSGFSARNLRYMKHLYLAYSDASIWQQPVAKLKRSLKTSAKRQPAVAIFDPNSNPLVSIQKLVAQVPWSHNLVILEKTTEPEARLFYLMATAQYSWTRKVLLTQLKGNAYERAVAENKTHNFTLALPEHLAEQAQEVMKSSYYLEWTGLTRAVSERDLEDKLIEHLQAFLLELGYGFCFVGRQHRLTLRRKEYFVDLLFYHRFLKSLVAFDLKLGEFEPEHAGKMDFYLNLLNDKERGPDDNPSIGIILCAEKDDVEVEYALRTKTNPIGVAEYELKNKLPGNLRGKLPTAKQLTDVVKRVMLDGNGGKA